MKNLLSSEGLDAEAALLSHPGFSKLDLHFARLIGRLAARHRDEAMLAAALASHGQSLGHICVNLRNASELHPRNGDDTMAPVPTVPSLGRWREALRQSGVVGLPSEFKPLILDDHDRLYLHRYWSYEDSLARSIEARVHAHTVPPPKVSPQTIHEIVARYFPDSDSPEPDWQKAAVLTASSRRFCVISGGPGTGKTRTIAVLIAVLVESAGGRPPRIALTAPTGRAANRLQESLQAARDSLPMSAATQAILPDSASTVHRLLGTIAGSSSFRHHAGNPLPHDAIVVDEASMVDLALMSKLFAACRPEARIVLVGDKDQLSSVEAGAVLGDICHGAAAPGHSPTAESGLETCIVQLRRNYRFNQGSGLAKLSAAVNEGRTADALKLLQVERTPQSAITCRSLTGAENLSSLLRDQVLEGFSAVRRAPGPREALDQLGRSRILCAVRKGPHGVEQLNQIVEKLLADAGLIRPASSFYPGRPILILKNDHRLRLYNGDVGIILPDAKTGQLRAWFIDAGNQLTSLVPSRLPEHETAFAMTVHKSQGSEFENVLLILPQRDSPILTRELVYTGITRARSHLTLWLDESIFVKAVARKAARTSGLAARLWGME